MKDENTVTKHTSGPWKLKPVHGGVPGRRAIYACNALGERLVCAAPSDEANARLIAAAPELLDALRVLLADTEEFHDAPDDEEKRSGAHTNCGWCMGRAVIGKAEGR